MTRLAWRPGHRAVGVCPVLASVAGAIGGSNWGGVAVDPRRGIVVANVTHVPFVVTLLPAAEYEARRAADPEADIRPQRGTPYAVQPDRLVSPLGLSCVKPPWGMLTVIDLAGGEILWRVRHGTVRDIAPVPIPWRSGTPTLGGPLVTGSGLVFIGAAMDDYLRAHDVRTGEELWRGRLPAAGIATPMTHRTGAGGRQLVVIAAGGHSRGGMTLGDSLVALALPE